MGSFEDLEYVTSMKDKLSKVDHGIPPQTLDLVLSEYLQEEDPIRKANDRELLEELLRCHSPKLVLSQKPHLQTPNVEDCLGDVVVGSVTRGDETLWDFSIPSEELDQGHMLIVSRSGHGKTTLLMNLVTQLLDRGVPFIITDYKRDFRSLARQYPQLIVLNRQNLRVNMLKPPPKVTIEEYKQEWLNIFSHVEGVWSGSTQFFLEILDTVYSKKGENATIADVYRELKTDTPSLRRLQDYWSAVYTRIYGLHSKLGPVIECEGGLDIEKLLTKPVVLELDGFGGFEDQNLLILYFFSWIYLYRKVHLHRGRARHWFIIDEAKRVFPASEQYSSTTREYSHISPIDKIVDEIRDFSEVLVAADNEVSKLSDSIISQSYMKVIGNLAGKDLRIISEAVNFDDYEKGCIPGLERGEWIVKLASRYTKPFFIKTGDFPVDKNIGDEEIATRMEKLLPEIMIDTPKNSITASPITKNDRELLGKSPIANSLRLPTLSDDAMSLLLNVNKHPFKGVSGRYKILNLSGRRATSAKKELIINGLTKEVSVPLGSYRPVKFLVLTPIAIHSLENSGYDVRLWKHTQGQFKHQLFTILIGYSFRRAGFKTYLEKPLRNGRRVDVLTVIDGKTLAIEIEVGKGLDLRNELKALEEVDELIIVSDEEETITAVKKAIIDGQPNVEAYHITDYLRHLKEIYNIETNGNYSNNSQNQNSHLDSGNKAGNKGK